METKRAGHRRCNKVRQEKAKNRIKNSSNDLWLYSTSTDIRRKWILSKPSFFPSFASFATPWLLWSEAFLLSLIKLLACLAVLFFLQLGPGVPFSCLVSPTYTSSIYKTGLSFPFACLPTRATFYHVPSAPSTHPPRPSSSCTFQQRRRCRRSPRPTRYTVGARYEDYGSFLCEGKVVRVELKVPPFFPPRFFPRPPFRCRKHEGKGELGWNPPRRGWTTRIHYSL